MQQVILVLKTADQLKLVMPANGLRAIGEWSVIQKIYALFWVVFLVGFPFSRTLPSIALTVNFILSFFLIKKTNEGDKYNKSIWIFWGGLILLYSLQFTDFFREIQGDIAFQLTLKLPFIFVPWLILNDLKSGFTKKIIPELSALFTLTIALVNVLSLLHYFQHFEAINESLLRAKHIPITGKIHHIQFSLISAASLLYTLYYLVVDKQRLRQWKPFLIGLWLFNFGALHVFSSRTGVICFYFAIGIWLLHFAFAYKKWKILSAGLLALFILPVASYYLVPSFKNKVKNTEEDLTALFGGGNPNYQSFAMRVEAWKMATVLVKEKPLIGYGSTAVKAEMDSTYVRMQSPMYEENRIEPHNQVFYYSIAFGIGAGVLLLLTFIVPFVLNMLRLPALSWALFGMILLSMLVESMLERQYGILFVLINFVIALTIKQNQKLKQNVNL